MESKLTKKDHQILQYVCEHFSCKICSNILMQCVTLPCGHNYCSYCLDLLHAGMQNECPECASPIRCAKANNSIDQKIDNMLSSCSEFIQKAYASALDSRFQKAFDRNLARRNNARMNPDYNMNDETKPKHTNCLDEIRNTLQMNDINPQHSVSKSLKSARRFQSHRKTEIIPERPSSSRPRSRAAPSVGVTKPCETPQASSEIDINKANLLFGIYDHVLGLDTNEPNKDMAAGDFCRENDVPPPINMSVLEGLSNYTKRSEVELEQLIKETDDIIRLDGHIQEWTNKMKNALNGNSESIGLAESKADKNIHIVDDELWKASNELLQKLQGIQKQRKIVTQPHLSLSCPSTPVPRSAKVNFEALSDDSDEESYDNAMMDILHGCLENTYDFSPLQSSSQDSEEDKAEIQDNHGTPKVTNAKKCVKQSDQHNDGGDGKVNKNIGKSSSGNRSARKKSILESMEESGHNYIKENIEFITKMRKYKEALMKIQNREVVTAQEIKELVPTTTFPSDGQDSTTLTKCEAPTTPRRLSGPRRNHSYSARLPMSARLVDHKPMTATYDAPSTQSIRKQITSAPTPTSKQYLSRSRASNSIFTAR